MQFHFKNDPIHSKQIRWLSRKEISSHLPGLRDDKSNYESERFRENLLYPADNRQNALKEHCTGKVYGEPEVMSFQTRREKAFSLRLYFIFFFALISFFHFGVQIQL